MKLTPLGDKIFFVFADEIISDHFQVETKSGLIIKETALDVGTKDRWGLITNVGKDVTEVKIGQYVLIEKLKWTNAIRMNEQKIWMTNQNHILAVSDTKPNII